MGNFQGRGGNRGGSFRGGNGGGGFRGGNRGGRSEVTMHKAICDECNKNCEVPFRPSGDKPIYCSDCFISKRNDGDRGPKRDFNDKPAQSFIKTVGVSQGNDVSKQLGEMNSKLDRLLTAIEKLAQPKVEVKPVAKEALVKKVEVKKVPATKVVAKKSIAVKVPAKKVIAKKKK